MILTSVISSLILISPKCSEISYIKKNELLIYDYGGKDVGDIVTLESVGLKPILHNPVVFKKKKTMTRKKIDASTTVHGYHVKVFQIL